MGVIETRAKVSIIDGASSGLNNMASANERLTSSLGIVRARRKISPSICGQ